MNTKKMAKRLKDSGVSPVIATILMVAITVVLAAVLYVMVSGFTHSPGTANSAGLNEATSTNANNWTVTVSSVSTSNIQLSTLKIVISGATGTNAALVDGTYTFSSSASFTPGGSAVAMSNSAATDGSVSFTVISGNSGNYLNVGDYFSVGATSIATSVSLSGATVTLYSGNTNLGSVTL